MSRPQVTGEFRGACLTSAENQGSLSHWEKSMGTTRLRVDVKQLLYNSFATFVSDGKNAKHFLNSSLLTRRTPVPRGNSGVRFQQI